MSNASELNDSSSLYYNFFIYTDTGSCIFKSVSSKTSEDEIGAMNGIIQALFFSASDLKGSINFLSTDLGTLTYKSYQYKDNTILFALIFPNFYADETIAEKMAEFDQQNQSSTGTPVPTGEEQWELDIEPKTITPDGWLCY